MKTCKRCKQSLEEARFYSNKKAKDGLLYMCKDCSSKDSARRYQEGQGYRIEKEKAKYWSNPEKHRVRKRIARSDPSVKAAIKEANSNWQKNNPHKVVVYSMKRRAAKLRATPKWMAELSEFVFDEAALLAKLRKQSTGFAWDVDHIVPLQSKLVCGLHTFSNIAVVSASINRSRSNRYWADMPEKRS